jgi:hypothetical protein
MGLANHRPPATTAGAATTRGARIDQALRGSAARRYVKATDSSCWCGSSAR